MPPRGNNRLPRVHRCINCAERPFLRTGKTNFRAGSKFMDRECPFRIPGRTEPSTYNRWKDSTPPDFNHRTWKMPGDRNSFTPPFSSNPFRTPVDDPLSGIGTKRDRSLSPANGSKRVRFVDIDLSDCDPEDIASRFVDHFDSPPSNQFHSVDMDALHPTHCDCGCNRAPGVRFHRGRPLEEWTPKYSHFNLGFAGAPRYHRGHRVEEWTPNRFESAMPAQPTGFEDWKAYDLQDDRNVLLRILACPYVR